LYNSNGLLDNVKRLIRQHTFFPLNNTAATALQESGFIVGKMYNEGTGRALLYRKQWIHFTCG
jgi:hypothetical protein